MFRGNKVTGDKIFGAISAYLLLGFFWSTLYTLVFTIQPEAFVISQPPGTHAERPDFVYFSFITLLTIGYGDITPTSGMARSLAILEGVAGIMYIGVFISRIVMLYHQASDQ